MSTQKAVSWPKEYESLRLRCQKCSQIFNCYECDKELFELRLCPACFVEMRNPRLVVNVNRLIGLGLCFLTVCAFWTVVYVVYFYVKH